jgi:monomeric isocitrate dehydrogenase
MISCDSQIYADLKAEFASFAKALSENETKVLSKLNSVQGNAVNIGG